jgi:hypothetical protein
LQPQKTKADWPNVIFGVPPFDHTTCNISFSYKTEGACPAADTGVTLDMYSKLAGYAHSILER